MIWFRKKSNLSRYFDIKYLEYEKIETLHNIAVLESKLIKLEILPEPVDRIKNSVL